MKPVFQGGFAVAKETMDVDVVAGKKHDAGTEVCELRNQHERLKPLDLTYQDHLSGLRIPSAF